MTEVATNIATIEPHKERRGRRIALLFAAVALIAALLCNGCVSPLHAYVTDVDPFGWRMPATVYLPNTDTVAMHDLQIFIRCNDRFRARNIPLQISVLTPDSLRYHEAFVISVPRQHSPSSIGHENWVTFRHNVRLHCEGVYQFVIRPDSTIEGIEAIGINIAKSE